MDGHTDTRSTATGRPLAHTALKVSAKGADGALVEKNAHTDSLLARRSHPRPAALALCLAFTGATACSPATDPAEAALQDTASPTPAKLLPATPAVTPLDTGPPGSWGTAPAWASPEQVAAAEWINWSRAAVSLPALGSDPILTAAAQAHADYITAHTPSYDAGLSLHAEVAGTDGFTGATWVDRAAHAGWEGPILGEVIAYQPLAVASVWQWMNSLYHRLPLLGPAASSLGYGSSHQGDVWIGVVEVGRRENVPDRLAGWPPQDAEDVPVSWDGFEVPQPPAPAAGFPSGPMLTVQGLPGDEIRLTSHVLLDPQGTKIPHIALDGTTDALLKDHGAVALYAEAPLEPGVTYHARVDGVRDGQTFTWEWRFTTRTVAGCSPTLQDCPPGRGCYADASGARCAWHGPIPEGGSCTWQNDCLPGTACQEGVCRRFCDVEGSGPTACEASCPGAWSGLKSAGLGVCDAPTCSPLYGGCAAGESCVAGGNTCVLAGSVPPGAACDGPSDCAAGSTCADLGDGDAICLSECDATPLGAAAGGTSTTPACTAACAHGAVAILDGSGVGFCVP